MNANPLYVCLSVCMVVSQLKLLFKGIFNLYFFSSLPFFAPTEKRGKTTKSMSVEESYECKYCTREALEILDCTEDILEAGLTNLDETTMLRNACGCTGTGGYVCFACISTWRRRQREQDRGSENWCSECKRPYTLPFTSFHEEQTMVVVSYNNNDCCCCSRSTACNLLFSLTIVLYVSMQTSLILCLKSDDDVMSSCASTNFAMSCATIFSSSVFNYISLCGDEFSVADNLLLCASSIFMFYYFDNVLAQQASVTVMTLRCFYNSVKRYRLW